ncbi:hypothetical protein [Nocardioides rubriscoriae]|uniref:hypothetical protein n=1 Tax=Nocardioides rubriscoriae TaxID=642762 RepID=UPI0011DFDF3C|nr:hypothetical protein [Nocardioides rubriscoriae]
MTNYTRAVYDHLRTQGVVGGPEFKTDIHPWLMHEFDLGADEAHLVRARVMRELKERGMVERINIRGNLRILTEYYPDPCSEPDGKFVDSGLRPVET